jgi:hypothetical protein
MDRRSFLRTPLLALAAYASARKAAPVAAPIVPDPEALRMQISQAIWQEVNQQIHYTAFVSAIWFAR